MTSPYAFDKSILWNIGIKPEVLQLLYEVNPNWQLSQYVTTEFYLDPIANDPEKYKFLYASPKSRQKWYISHYLTSLGWVARTPNNKTSVLVNPTPGEKPARVPTIKTLRRAKANA
jgi:hypothetical protein